MYLFIWWWLFFIYYFIFFPLAKPRGSQKIKVEWSRAGGVGEERDWGFWAWLYIHPFQPNVPFPWSGWFSFICKIFYNKSFIFPVSRWNIETEQLKEERSMAFLSLQHQKRGSSHSLHQWCKLILLVTVTDWSLTCSLLEYIFLFNYRCL